MQRRANQSFKRLAGTDHVVLHRTRILVASLVLHLSEAPGSTASLEPITEVLESSTVVVRFDIYILFKVYAETIFSSHSMTKTRPPRPPPYLPVLPHSGGETAAVCV